LAADEDSILGFSKQSDESESTFEQSKVDVTNLSGGESLTSSVVSTATINADVAAHIQFESTQQFINKERTESIQDLLAVSKYAEKFR
jgi:hypothetical protein